MKGLQQSSELALDSSGFKSDLKNPIPFFQPGLIGTGNIVGSSEGFLGWEHLLDHLMPCQSSARSLRSLRSASSMLEA